MPDDLAEFLKETPELSPSKVLQAKLKDLKEDWNTKEIRFKALEQKIFNLSQRLNKLMEFLEDRGLTNEFLAQE